MIQEQLLSLLADRSSIVKRAVLHNTSSLCIFFRRQKTNDVLLSHMITYLNDRDWLLRYAFFQSIVDVAVCVGGRSLDEYILPLMIQSLSGERYLVSIIATSLTACRCRGIRSDQSFAVAYFSVRTWIIPENANLGTNERNYWFPIPPKHLDSTRYLRAFT